MPELKRKIMLASTALVLLTNVVVLAGVAYNRTGEPLATIELTERELPVAYSYRAENENSGTALTLNWNVLDSTGPVANYSNYGSPDWLSDTKLTELGFDMQQLGSGEHRYRLSSYSAEAIIVLEYQGETYRKAIERSENRRMELEQKALRFPEDETLRKRYDAFTKDFNRHKITQSRLYAIDAVHSVKSLMQKYSSPGKYMFARGEIGLRYVDDEIKGYIKQIHVRQVHASLPFSKKLAGLSESMRSYTYMKDPIPPRYSVSLSIGKRLEPWITSVSELSNSDFQKYTSIENIRPDS